MDKRFKYVLFDWDGCLVKTLHVWLEAYKAVFKEENLNPTDEEIISKAFSQREKGMENIGSVNPQLSWDKVVLQVNRNVSDVPFYDGVLGALEVLKERHIKMALLTQSDKSTVMPVIEDRDIKKYFEVILTKDDVKNKKPDPEIAIKAMQFMLAKPEETIIVGDSYHDIQCGKNAGISTCAFYPEENGMFYKPEDIQKESPDFTVKNFRELLEILK